MFGIGTFVNRVILDTGSFYCPVCDGDQGYLHLRFIKYIMILWLPLFRLSEKKYTPAEQIECRCCGTAYSKDILSNTAGVDIQSFNESYRLLVRKIMIHMTLADQVIEESEIQVCAQTWRQHFGEALNVDVFRTDLLTETDSQETLLDLLEHLLPALDQLAKATLKSIMETIANADGEFHDLERLFYQRICSRLDQ